MATTAHLPDIRSATPQTETDTLTARAPSTGFVPLLRTHHVEELIATAPKAFVLATIIAMRARFMPGISLDGRSPGEAFLGDYEKYGMTRQEYRHALKQLEKWGFATSRTTSRGTIARLTDMRLFDVGRAIRNQQFRQQRTNADPLTRREEGKNVGKKKEGENRNWVAEPRLSPEELEAECWRLADEYELDGDFVQTFIDQHNRDNWTIRGNPIHSLKAALVGLCNKLSADRGD